MNRRGRRRRGGFWCWRRLQQSWNSCKWRRRSPCSSFLASLSRFNDDFCVNCKFNKTWNQFTYCKKQFLLVLLSVCNKFGDFLPNVSGVVAAEEEEGEKEQTVSFLKWMRRRSRDSPKKRRRWKKMESLFCFHFAKVLPESPWKNKKRYFLIFIRPKNCCGSCTTLIPHGTEKNEPNHDQTNAAFRCFWKRRRLSSAVGRAKEGPSLLALTIRCWYWSKK